MLKNEINVVADIWRRRIVLTHWEVIQFVSQKNAIRTLIGYINRAFNSRFIRIKGFE